MYFVEDISIPLSSEINIFVPNTFILGTSSVPIVFCFFLFSMLTIYSTLFTLDLLESSFMSSLSHYKSESSLSFSLESDLESNSFLASSLFLSSCMSSKKDYVVFTNTPFAVFLGIFTEFSAQIVEFIESWMSTISL